MIRAALIWLVLATPALSVEPGEMLADPGLEARARDLSKELRCLICRNESIDDSHATIARDLRLLLRERLSAGDSDTEAVSFIVDRFGEYVLLNPTTGGANLILWLAGPGLLIAGAGLAIAYTRRRAQGGSAEALTPEEQARLRELTES